MSNFNINRTTTEPDSIPTTIDKPKQSLSLRGIAPVILSIAAVLGVFWLLFIMLASIYCSVTAYGVGTCTAFSIAFWSVPLVAGIAAIIALIAGAVFLVQAGVNAAWLDTLGLPVHREDTRAAYARLLDVAYRRAESEASRGIDTYSPSYSNTAQKEPIAPISNKDPLKDAKIAIEDIFNYRED